MTTRRRSPAARSAATVTRPTSRAALRRASRCRPGPRRRGPCRRPCGARCGCVEWTSTTRCVAARRSPRTASGDSSTAAARGSACARLPPARSRAAPTGRRRAAARRAARPRTGSPRRRAARTRRAASTGRVRIAPAGDRHSARAAQDAGAQVELALVREQLPVADVERLVVDEQPDDLPVRHVDDRLAGLRVAVARLGVGERAQLVERVQVRPGQRRTARPRRGSPRSPMCPFESAKTDSRLREHVEVELGLAHRPRLDCERGMRDHALEQLREVSDDDVGAVLAQCLAPVPRGRLRRRSRIRRRAPPRRRRVRPRRRRPAPARRSSARAAARNVSGAGFPFRCSRRGDDPVDAHLEQVGDSGGLEHVAAVRARGDDRAAQARLARGAHVAHRARRRRSTPCAADQREHELVLAVAEPVDRVSRRADRPALPRAARSRARRGTSARRRSAACRRRTGRSRATESNGTNGSPVARLRARRRNASNISFHAAACMRAVCVSTPSRSKRHARIVRGNPNRPDSIDRISLFVWHQRRLGDDDAADMVARCRGLEARRDDRCRQSLFP